MATYDKEIDYINSKVYLKLKDRSIYGSSRVGVRSTDIDMLALHNPNYSMKSVKYEIGKRTYELSNHLGNVLSVISDKVIPSFEGGNLVGMLADVRIAQDYSPFGVTLSGRSFEVDGGYRYGYQNQEVDNEIKGEGNSLNYKYRMHDPRVGRFLSIDPLSAKYPWNSPYAFSENRVIDGIDLEGKEFYYSASGTLLGKIGNSTEVRVVNADRIKALGGEANYSKAIQRIQNGLNSGYAKSTKHHAYLNSVSRSTGMNNEELMLRATLTTIRKAEGHGTMEVYNRDEIGTVFTSNKSNDTDGSLASDGGYNSHPGSDRYDASGAYQIQKGTWDTYTNANYEGLNQNSEFTPENQDKMALVLINEQKLYNPSKKDVFENIYSGNTDKIWEQLKGTWVSLPGGSQEGINKTDAVNFFKEAIKNELNGDTSIATPQGSLSVPKKK